MDNETFKARFQRDYSSMYNAAPNGFTALDFVGALGSIHDALLYSWLFLPEFIEVDGMIFLAYVLHDAGGKEKIRKLYDQYGNRRKVEESLNSFDLTLNLRNRLNENAPDDDRLLAEQIAISWRLRLNQFYPDRAFVVSVFDEEGEVGLVFYQKENPEQASGA